MNQDNFNGQKYSPAINAAAITVSEAIVGNIIDLLGFESATMIINFGLSTASATLAVLLEEGDDSGLSDAAAVADADLIGTELGAALNGPTEGNSTSKLGYIGGKRFIRLTVTASSLTGDGFVAADCALSNARHDAQTSQVVSA